MLEFPRSGERGYHTRTFSCASALAENRGSWRLRPLGEPSIQLIRARVPAKLSVLSSNLGVIPPMTAPGKKDLIPPSLPVGSDSSREPNQPLETDKRSDTNKGSQESVPAVGSTSETQDPYLTDPRLLQQGRLGTARAPSGGAIVPPGIGNFGDDYELLEIIGRGGMGVVHKAHQKSLDRFVALKLILSSSNAPAPSRDVLERFLKESQAAAKLDHPNIVPVFVVGQVAGEPYYTMKLVTGGSLQQLIVKRGPLPPLVAARMLRSIADAIRCAHESEPQVIHCDIKPQNILLYRAGNAKAPGNMESSPGVLDSLGSQWEDATPMVADFGLARVKAARSGSAMAELNTGTPSYMSPEQTGVDPGAVGPSSDIYSLGAVLYCMLTTRPPFQAKDAEETKRQVREAEPPSMRKANPGVRVPRDLQTICFKCLAKNPKARYATTRELIDDLDCFLADQPLEHAHRIGPIRRTAGRLGRAIKRRPLRSVYIIVSLAAMVLLTGVFVRRAIIAREQAEAKTAYVNSAIVRAGRLVQDADALRDQRQLDGAMEKYDSAIAAWADLNKQGRPAGAELAYCYTQRGILFYDNRRDFQSAIQELMYAKNLLAEQDDRDSLLKLAEVYHRLGDLYNIRPNLIDSATKRVDFKKSDEYYSKATAIRRGLWVANDGEFNCTCDLARSLGYTGGTKLKLGEKSKAMASFVEAQELRDKLAKADHLPDKQKTIAKYQFARTLWNFGLWNDWNGEAEKAFEAYSRQLSYMEREIDSSADAELEFQTDLADCYVSIAGMELDLPRQPTDAREQLEAARVVYEGFWAQDSSAESRHYYDSHLAEINLLLAKDAFLWNENARAKKHIETAKAHFKKIKSTKQSPEDVFNKALTTALEPLLDQGILDRDRERVMDLLVKAFDMGYRNIERLNRDRILGPYRNDRRYQNLLVAWDAERKSN